MKILIVTTISSTVDSFLVPHIRLLRELGHQVDVAFSIVRESSPEIYEMGCKIHPIDFQRSPISKKNHNAYKAIQALVAREGYQLIHVHTPVAALLTRMACRHFKGTKVIYTAHGFHFFKGAPKKNWILYHTFEKFSSRWTDGIITINEEDYQAAKRFKLRRKDSVDMVHGVGIDLNRYKPQTLEHKTELRDQYGFKQDAFILIYAGELSYRKHQDMVIDAMAVLKNKIPNIQLLLAGEGEFLETYQQQISRLGLDEYVMLLGYRTDVDNLMQLSDIAISTSRQEGLPVNVMEAMATGLPLVVTNCRGNRDLVVQDENGFIVEIDDVNGFAIAIDNIYKSEDLRNRFVTNSCERIKSYGLDPVLLEMKKVYIKYL